MKYSFVEYCFQEVLDQSYQQEPNHDQTYQIIQQRIYNEKQHRKNYLMKRIGNKQQQLKIPYYQVTAKILQNQHLNIPVVLLQNNQHSKHTPKLTIIYSHGNSSDVLDAFDFFAKFVQFQDVNVVIYDFTGYGISNMKVTTQKTLCEDLDLIINWLNVPREEIVLWGFSLGTYPTVNIAAKYHLGGVILQSPIASASFFLQNQQQIDNQNQKQQNKQKQKRTPYKYSIDSLDNLKHIGQIKSPVIIFHSSQDQIIPISHARKLYNIIRMEKKSQKYMLIEVSKLNHNQMHCYFCAEISNPLKSVMSQFLESIRCKIIAKRINKFEKQHNIKQHRTYQPSPTNSKKANFNSLKDQHSLQWSMFQNTPYQIPTMSKYVPKNGKSHPKVQKSCPNIDRSYLLSPKSQHKPSDKNRLHISIQSNLEGLEEYKNYQNDNWQWEVQDQQELQTISKVINDNTQSKSSLTSKRTHQYFNLCTKNHKSYFHTDIRSSNASNNQIKINNNMSKTNKINTIASLSKKL